MLEIEVALEESESYDETTNKFVNDRTGPTFKVQLEHSLFTVSKWESLWEEAFLGKKEKTQKQTISYVEMMIVNDDLPPGVFSKLLKNHLGEVMDYVKADMTATKLRSDPNAPQSREVLTSELIYYWMISMNIPVEFEHWHLNRLLTLIRVITLKNTPQKKMTAKERQQLNKSRRAQYNTRG